MNPHGTEFRPPLVLSPGCTFERPGELLEDTEHLPWLAQGEPKLNMEKVRMEQPVRMALKCPTPKVPLGSGIQYAQEGKTCRESEEEAVGEGKGQLWPEKRGDSR